MRFAMRQLLLCVMIRFSVSFEALAEFTPGSRPCGPFNLAQVSAHLSVHAVVTQYLLDI